MVIAKTLMITLRDFGQSVKNRRKTALAVESEGAELFFV